MNCWKKLKTTTFNDKIDKVSSQNSLNFVVFLLYADFFFLEDL